MSGLDGQVVLVTGASRGIGLGIACGLAKAGAQVVMNYRSDAQRAEEALEHVRALNPTATLFQADIAVPKDVTAMFRHVQQTYGRLDGLVQNAGITADGYALMMGDEKWQRVIDTNLSGAFACLRAAGSDDDPAALRRDRGGRLDERGERAGRTGELRRLEGRAAGHGPGAGQGARTEQRPGQRRRPRLRRDRDDSGHAGRPARRVLWSTSRCAGSANQKRLPTLVLFLLSARVALHHRSLLGDRRRNDLLTVTVTFTASQVSPDGPAASVKKEFTSSGGLCK